MRALEAAYSTYRRRLLHVARQHGDHAHAEDAVQDAFLCVLERAKTGRPSVEGYLYNYLRCVVRGQAKNNRPLYAYEGREAGHTPSLLTRIAAQRVWQELTAAERLAVANLHILEEDLSRADQGLFARRIRLAGARLRKTA